MTTIIITQLFNGQLAGHGRTTHAVESRIGLCSVESVARSYQEAGDGWGFSLSMDAEAATELGAYETDYGWVIDAGSAGVLAVEISQ